MNDNSPATLPLAGVLMVALDLKRNHDMQLLCRVISRADVFIQNLAPGIAEHLGIGVACGLTPHPCVSPVHPQVTGMLIFKEARP